MQSCPEIDAPSFHPQVDQISTMRLRATEIAPQSDFLPRDADFERLSWLAGNAAYTPMISHILAVREQVAGEVFDAQSQFTLNFLGTHSFLRVPPAQVS
jgi:hypothetical protein